MNQYYREKQRLITMIRHYFSSLDISVQWPVNSIFDVETSLKEFRLLHKNSDIEVQDDELRALMCQEALRRGMVLHFGKAPILEKSVSRRDIDTD